MMRRSRLLLVYGTMVSIGVFAMGFFSLWVAASAYIWYDVGLLKCLLCGVCGLFFCGIASRVAWQMFQVYRLHRRWDRFKKHSDAYWDDNHEVPDDGDSGIYDAYLERKESNDARHD